MEMSRHFSILLINNQNRNIIHAVNGTTEQGWIHMIINRPTVCNDVTHFPNHFLEIDRTYVKRYF